MGKNKIIKSLGRCIGNVAMHKLLLLHTNKPESKSYLNFEVIEYGADAFEKAQEFNWNEKDKQEILDKSRERIKKLSHTYPDVKYSSKEMEEILKETIKDLFGE
jgi:hypothetical protein